MLSKRSKALANANETIRGLQRDLQAVNRAVADERTHRAKLEGEVQYLRGALDQALRRAYAPTLPTPAQDKSAINYGPSNLAAAAAAMQTDAPDEATIVKLGELNEHINHLLSSSGVVTSEAESEGVTFFGGEAIDAAE